MIRSNSKQSGGIRVVKPEERKGKAAVGRICDVSWWQVRLCYPLKMGAIHERLYIVAGP